MKCPKCGAWNQAYLPKCNRCGTELPKADPLAEADWEADLHRKKPYLQITSFNDKDTLEDAEKTPPPQHTTVSEEIEELIQRREEGAHRLRRFRQQAAQVSHTLKTAEVLEPLPEPGDPGMPLVEMEVSETEPAEEVLREEHLIIDQHNKDVPVFYDGYEGNEQRQADPRKRHSRGDAEKVIPIDNERRHSSSQFVYSATKEKRSAGYYVLRVFLLLLACVLASAASVYAARTFVFSHGLQANRTTEAVIEVTATEIDGHPGHLITIRGRENATVYMPEMQSSYILSNGQVEIPVPDYMWYDTDSSVYAVPCETDTMDITITPYIRYSQEGEQFQLEPIRYTIDVPLSPIYLINPTTKRVELGVSIYEVRINVNRGSTVIIDGTNVSTLIRDTGNVSKNVQVLPVGDNTISISVKSKFYRENKMEVVLYREPQEIPLELAPTVIVEWNYEADNEQYQASISGTTLPGADITIESPHENLTLNKETGAFSFKPLFTKLGNNDVVIRASYPGKADSVITHTVYYMPTADVYTRRAWNLDTQYSDLITYISMRIGTIYVGEGVITRIISTAPQLAIINIGSDGLEKNVMIENSSKTTWVVGTRYRIYGEAYGMYGNMPRLTVRYTYLEE